MDDSIMVPTGDEIDQLNIEDLGPESRAVYGYHRPDIRNPPEPLSHVQAVRKYRKQADPNISDYAR